MTNELDSWDRPEYVPGGSEPFLFYVLYGDIDWSSPLSRSKYRTNGPTTGIDMMSYGPEAHAEVPVSFCEGYIWDELVEENPSLANQIQNCERCTVFRGTPEESTNLNYLRDVIGMIAFGLDHGGRALYDPFMIKWWSPDEWRTRIFEHGQAQPTQHAVTLLSPEDQTTWIHTRGMIKFGRPDISICNVTPDLENAAIELCKRLICYQADGGMISEGKEIQMQSLPDGIIARHGGSMDDPDFNNVHIEFVVPNG